MKYSIIQSTEWNKYVSVRNERDLRKLGVESCRAEREEWEIEGVAIYSN